MWGDKHVQKEMPGANMDIHMTDKTGEGDSKDVFAQLQGMA